MSEGRLPWRQAMERALYGEHGFYRRTDGEPAAHFRTSVHASPLFAQTILTLARSPGLRTIVDVGAGGGELLRTLHTLDPALALVGVDVRERPPGLAARIEWTASMPTHLDGLVVANEWLDNVPVEVVEFTDEGWRLVLVDPEDGTEELGPEPEQVDLEWLHAWWPRGLPGDRAEVGGPRDTAWAGTVGSLRRGIAVAVDYAHRRRERPPNGSMAGYLRGRLVPTVPDGSADITSHVALDACAAAGEIAGAAWTVLTTQRSALQALGVRRDQPAPVLARTDPIRYLRTLESTGEVAELTDPGGLGGFGWLVQGVGTPIPQQLTGTDE